MLLQETARRCCVFKGLTLWEVVVLSADDGLEARNVGCEVDELALATGEHLGHGEGLRQELLEAAGARDRELVVL